MILDAVPVTFREHRLWAGSPPCPGHHLTTPKSWVPRRGVGTAFEGTVTVTIPERFLFALPCITRRSPATGSARALVAARQYLTAPLASTADLVLATWRHRESGSVLPLVY